MRVSGRESSSTAQHRVIKQADEIGDKSAWKRPSSVHLGPLRVLDGMMTGGVCCGPAMSSPISGTSLAICIDPAREMYW